MRAWATAQGYALEALPDPAARTAGDPDPAARRRLGRQDARLLAEGLRRLAGAARVQALLVGERDAHGQAGRAWFGRVLAAAEQAGIELPRATRVAPTVPLDPALLERRIALEAG